MNQEIRIGVDLGGTKIEVIALDPAGTILARWRCDAPRDDYHATLGAVRDCVTRVESAVGAHGSVGIGTPGALSRVTGLLKNSNSTWLNGRPIVADLEHVLGRPVRIASSSCGSRTCSAVAA